MKKFLPVFIGIGLIGIVSIFLLTGIFIYIPTKKHYQSNQQLFRDIYLAYLNEPIAKERLFSTSPLLKTTYQRLQKSKTKQNVILESVHPEYNLIWTNEENFYELLDVLQYFMVKRIDPKTQELKTVDRLEIVLSNEQLPMNRVLSEGKHISSMNYSVENNAINIRVYLNPELIQQKRQNANQILNMSIIHAIITTLSPNQIAGMSKPSNKDSNSVIQYYIDRFTSKTLSVSFSEKN